MHLLAIRHKKNIGETMALRSENGLAREVSVTTSSAATAIPNASSYYKIVVVNTSTHNVHYRLGASASTTAVAFSAGAGDPVIPPGSYMELYTKGMTHIAFVLGAGTASVQFYPYAELF